MPTLIDDAVEAAIETCVPWHRCTTRQPGRHPRRAPRPGQGAACGRVRHGFPRAHAAARAHLRHRAGARRGYGIRRYGFHGTSHAYVADLAAKPSRATARRAAPGHLHLGNGASACAVEYGHSTETSMGLTPLEGLVMGTRSGDIDPGVRARCCRATPGSDIGRRSTICSTGRAASLGLSGVGNDLRDIEARAAEGDDRCRLADRGLRASGAQVRRRLRRGDGRPRRGRASPAASARTPWRCAGASCSASISSGSCWTRIATRTPSSAATARWRASAPTRRGSRRWSVATDEELSIAQQTANVVASASAVDAPETPIPIAISARHVHLTEEPRSRELFGPGGHARPSTRTSRSPGSSPCERR